jgi:hypothetical protein
MALRCFPFLSYGCSGGPARSRTEFREGRHERFTPRRNHPLAQTVVLLNRTTNRIPLLLHIIHTLAKLRLVDVLDIRVPLLVLLLDQIDGASAKAVKVGNRLEVYHRGRLFNTQM